MLRRRKKTESPPAAEAMEPHSTENVVIYPEVFTKFLGLDVTLRKIKKNGTHTTRIISIHLPEGSISGDILQAVLYHDLKGIGNDLIKPSVTFADDTITLTDINDSGQRIHINLNDPYRNNNYIKLGKHHFTSDAIRDHILPKIEEKYPTVNAIEQQYRTQLAGYAARRNHQLASDARITLQPYMNVASLMASWVVNDLRKNGMFLDPNDPRINEIVEATRERLATFFLEGYMKRADDPSMLTR